MTCALNVQSELCVLQLVINCINDGPFSEQHFVRDTHQRVFHFFNLVINWIALMKSLQFNETVVTHCLRVQMSHVLEDIVQKEVLQASVTGIVEQNQLNLLPIQQNICDSVRFPFSSCDPIRLPKNPCHSVVVGRFLRGLKCEKPLFYGQTVVQLKGFN